MHNHFHRPFWFTIPALLFAIFTWKTVVPERAEAGTPAPSSGSLTAIGKNGPIGECPLKHTSVVGAIDGFVGAKNIGIGATVAPGQAGASSPCISPMVLLGHHSTSSIPGPCAKRATMGGMWVS